MIKDCVRYFRQNPVWRKVLRGFREKYSSYGRFGGKVVLQNLKPQEIEEPLQGKMEQKRLREQRKEYILQTFTEAYKNTPIGEQTEELLKIVKDSRQQ